MQPYHTEATVNNDGQVLLSLPFPKGQHVKITASPLNDTVEDDKAWERIAAEDFLRGYSEEDSIYDNY